MRSKTPSYIRRILYVKFFGKSNVFCHNVLKNHRQDTIVRAIVGIRFNCFRNYLNNICVLREAHWVHLDHPVRSHASVEHVLRPGSHISVEHVLRPGSHELIFFFLYYILTYFIAKSMRFLISIVKINAFENRLHIYSMKLSLANLMCFVAK